MELGNIDIWNALCIILIGYGAVRGWCNGLLKEIVSTIGFFVGLVLAYKFSDSIGGGTAGFLAIWIGAPLLLSMAASLLTKVIDHIFLVGGMNRMLGALLGAGKWAVLMLCVYLVRAAL